jgi:hypothetical protein
VIKHYPHGKLAIHHALADDLKQNSLKLLEDRYPVISHKQMPVNGISGVTANNNQMPHVLPRLQTVYLLRNIP